jgi:hypothetical protein
MYAKRQYRYRQRLNALRERLDAGDAQISLAYLTLFAVGMTSLIFLIYFYV